MGLPFLEPRKMSAMIIARRGKPDLETAPEIEAPGHEMNPEIKDAGQRVMSAFEAKSVVDLCKALQDFFEACDSMPHEEGEHEEEMGE